MLYVTGGSDAYRIVIKDTVDGGYVKSLTPAELIRLYEENEIIGVVPYDHKSGLSYRVLPVNEVELNLLKYLRYAGAVPKYLGSVTNTCGRVGNWHFFCFRNIPVSIAKLLYDSVEDDMQVRSYAIDISREKVEVCYVSSAVGSLWSIFKITNYTEFCKAICKYKMLRPAIEYGGDFEVRP